MEWLGRLATAQAPNSRRSALLAAMQAIAGYERMLGTRLLAGLDELPKVRLYGPPSMEGRVPTFAFTIEGHHPDAVAAHLARSHIHVWSGSFYALEPVRRLGLAESGGMVRAGLCHYSTAGEVDRLLETLATLS
jgi:selenocysteine lyase/cysteine desulfurase